jgi:hypothetical protein
MSVELPAATAPHQIGWLRVCMSVGRTAADEPWRPCPGPHLFYMWRWRQGPTNQTWLGAPDQGAR